MYTKYVPGKIAEKLSHSHINHLAKTISPTDLLLESLPLPLKQETKIALLMMLCTPYALQYRDSFAD